MNDELMCVCRKGFPWTASYDVLYQIFDDQISSLNQKDGKIHSRSFIRLHELFPSSSTTTSIVSVMNVGTTTSAPEAKKKQKSRKKRKLTYIAAIKLMDKYGTKSQSTTLFIVSVCLLTMFILFAVFSQDGVKYNQLDRKNDLNQWWTTKLMQQQRSIVL